MGRASLQDSHAALLGPGTLVHQDGGWKAATLLFKFFKKPGFSRLFMTPEAR
ncbi:Hypothetical protein AA314_08829 [Archangium gephyra]|uniref:Uncharacterized protein n=1 Tax=Archangium gephyra TaxID=48 RepID=A0AAC8QGA4_9BACT|nr:Hypothetical protein AA314_08829 [Archangium gephyra]